MLQIIHQQKNKKQQKKRVVENQFQQHTKVKYTTETTHKER